MVLLKKTATVKVREDYVKGYVKLLGHCVKNTAHVKVREVYVKGYVKALKKSCIREVP